MQKILLSLAFLSLLSFSNPAITYTIDKNAAIHWLGKKTTGQHEGDVTLKYGSLSMDGTIPVKGEFVLDMTSMTSTDIKDPDDNKKLMGHLKGDEFFDVKAFPTATLAAKKFEKLAGKAGEPNYTVTAELTIKGVTNEIRFPAIVDVQKDVVKASAVITVDRTKWKIVYKSKTIFPELGDKFIYDDMTFTVNLSLHK